MDLEKLKADWEKDPALQLFGGSNVQELADYLVDVHKFLVDPARSGPFAYLYRKQIELNRELKKELQDVRRNQRGRR